VGVNKSGRLEPDVSYRVVPNTRGNCIWALKTTFCLFVIETSSRRFAYTAARLCI
jgi:hypothetical protein